MQPNDHLTHARRLILALAVVIGGSASGVTLSSAVEPVTTNGPVKVEIRKSGDRFQLYVNHQPFYIKGAGIELGSPEKLKEHGGNSFRTWSTDNGRDTGKQVLDRALSNGLYVAMGLDVDHERRGFDYDNTNAVARQFETLTAQVREFKDHPALIIWVIGNELNMEKNPKVWDAVNDLSKAIHRIDPNHLTTTTLAGFKPETVALVKSRAPDLDFLSFQMYCDIVNLPKYLAQAAWDQPYLVTEWGATGHWECGRTAWGAPLENDSSTKADLYRMRFEKVIQSDQKLCLGSYVFFWGQKQERTPTWYGMFLNSGEETEPVDVMHYFWTGGWPAVRSPRVEGIWLDARQAAQNIHLQSGSNYEAKVTASDPNQVPLTYSWEILEESTERKVGGDAESMPLKLAGLITPSNRSEITLKAPDRPGAYRLFAYVYDGKGHAAHANIPFYVDTPAETTQAAVVSHASQSEVQR
ncbi:MAG TPA: glycoside hydrolase family 2 TIM barrel-domain containing protein [Candidatus Acidoferrum sp.]|nr:glycoside hydrolase family 2 TIM barrel-domain containing protein [Candidatus Acidoferrum sp.]